MAKRGRKSAAELAVIEHGGAIALVQRPPAPKELTDEEADEWRAVVDAEPADWFTRSTQGALVQLCRHIVNARRLAQLKAAFLDSPEFDVKGYREILRSEGEQSALIFSASTKLRITQQATIDKRRQKTRIKAPWEDQG